MVQVIKDDDNINQRTASTCKLLTTVSLGFIFVIIPISLLFFNPIQMAAEYNIRLDNGTMLSDLLSGRIDGPKTLIYLFNVTNAQEFLSGKDAKLKLQEYGPFAYQEYRVNKDLEINKEPGIMRYTPRVWAEFIPEESIARPEDVYLILPNIPLFLAASIVEKYPFFVRQMFNMFASSVRSKPFINITVYDFLWGYPDPLIKLANTAIPGLIYFNSTGIMERVYDLDADYRVELGTTNSDKFSVKKVSRFRKRPIGHSSQDLVNDIQNYTDTYEGAAFPTGLNPSAPINVYRHSICRTFRFEHVGLRKMYYGGEAYVYNPHNTTFNDLELCNSKGWCPRGLKNMSPCYMGMPFGLSKGHFLDADPHLADHIEGLKPDRKKHDAELVVDPRIGVAISGSISLQLNVFMTDVSYNPAVRRFKDMVLPVTHVYLHQPKMMKEVKSALEMVYRYGPKMLLTTQILFLLLSLGLLAYSSKLCYYNCIAVNSHIVLDKRLDVKSQLPLLNDKTKAEIIVNKTSI